ncbi:efflux RND transporter periplasmic adaptor subunit [Salipiger marinus]|uniref:efflux RND transporter periplasmic adaptor subunit n=1 Tax=Salipiger marinus TaxID=555512 RepID=UPI002C1A13DE|nr:efflux RND transporter periplasmic adaptor subunit [Salipiger manganoxidans]MEB3420633.1 efflux RND transporter periplasmic adaptor subunit [Salipiger manganoxidans]
MRLARILLGIVLIAGAGFFGFQMTGSFLAAAPEPGPGAGPGSGAPQALRVMTEPVEELDFAETVEAVGTTRARRSVELRPTTSGRVETLSFAPGDEVTAGTVLLRLEDASEQAALKAAEATLAEAQAAFDRQERLQASGSASEAAFDSARATLLRAEAERDMAAAELDDMVLRAPFDGVVGFTDLAEGQLVDSADPVTSLDDLALVEVAFSVPERVMGRVRLGQTVSLISAAWPDRVFAGSISAMDTRVDPATRSVALRAEVDNFDRALKPGMFIEVTLVLSERRAAAVPERALTVSGEQSYIHVVRDGRAARVDVVAGQSMGSRIEVSGDLEPGTLVITSNLHRISDGASVDPIAPQQAQVATP